MKPLPPPDPTDASSAGPPPVDAPLDRGPNRRRTVGIALAASVLAVGGIVAGSQLVGAERSIPSITTPDTEEPADDVDDETIDDVDEGPESDADDAFAEFDSCLSDKLGVDVTSELDEAVSEMVEALPPEVWEAAESACENLLPDDVRSELEALEVYEECLSDQLGELYPDDDWMDDWNGAVIVESPDGDFGTVFDFGEGDATVVVTKSGDEITTETTGDVTTLAEAELDDRWEEEAAEWEAAHDACAELLPDGAEIFDGMFEGMDDFLADLGEIDLGDFDLGELGDLDIGDFDIGELDDLDLGAIFEDGELGHLDLRELDDIELGDLGSILEDGDIGQLFEELERQFDQLRPEPQN